MFDVKIQRLVSWAKGGRAPPIYIELIPTDRCNSACLTCWRRGFTREQLLARYKEEISDERIMELIGEAAKLGVREIDLVGGGEPLVRPIIWDLMREIKQRGMVGDLVTNGITFDEAKIKELVELGWDRIKFSVDGPNARVHDYLRGVKCFDRVVRNIKRFAEYKKRFGTDKPRMMFNTVISDVNYKLLPQIVRLAHKTGCEDVWLLPMTVFAESMAHMKLTDEETAEFQGILLRSIALAKKLGVCNNFENFLDAKYINKTREMDEVMMEEVEKLSEEEIIKREYGRKRDPIEDFKFLPCFDPWHHVTIIANGNIAPCFGSWVWETKVTIKDHRLKDLWYGEYFDSFRRVIASRKLPKSCATCCVWKVFENRQIREGIDKFIQSEK